MLGITFTAIRARKVEVGNLLRDLLVTLLQSDLHHVGELAVSKLMTLEHLISREFTKVDACNLGERDQDVRLVGETFVHRMILVDEEGVLVENKVPSDNPMTLVQKLADDPFVDDAVLFSHLIHSVTVLLGIDEFVLFARLHAR